MKLSRRRLISLALGGVAAAVLPKAAKAAAAPLAIGMDLGFAESGAVVMMTGAGVAWAHVRLPETAYDMQPWTEADSAELAARCFHRDYGVF